MGDDALNIVSRLNKSITNPNAYVVSRCLVALQDAQEEVGNSSAEPCEETCLQWLLEFIDGQGGEITSQDLGPLYEEHPQMKEFIGKPKLRNFCGKYPDQLMYQASSTPSVAATIRRRELSEDECAEMLVQHIDEMGGTIASQDLSPVYAKHPTLKQHIGKRRLRDFCDNRSEVTYVPSDSLSTPGAAATVQISDSEYKKWMLQFVREHGGEVTTQDMAPLFKRHPSLKGVIGQDRTRSFCDKHPELLYVPSPGAPHPAKIVCTASLVSGAEVPRP